MSLILRDPFEWYRPSILTQRLWDPEEFLGAVEPREFRNWINLGPNWLSQVDSGARVTFDKDKFNVNIDVAQFKPNEVSVKVTDDNEITVEGKHEERRDEHGYISRQFVRRYVLPKDHDISKIESKLSSDGVLTISAPKTGDVGADYREIPITQTGMPSKPIEQKKEEPKN